LVIGSSARPVRVIQVSDCHVPQDPATPYRGLNADRNLASLLPAMRHWQPDLILLTGDVSEDGSAAAYGRVSAHLSTVGAPVVALPGNHDDPAVMRRYFPVGPWSGPHADKARNWQLLLLDSTVPGRVSGELDSGTLERLDWLLRASTASHVLVALHHQPVPMGSEWIDRYSLEQPSALLDLLDRHSRVRCVTWGHVHQGFEAQRKGMVLLGSPSTVANSLPDTEKFALDLTGPACRWLELGLDGKVSTGMMRAGYGA
jgi:Icc protein